MQDQPTRPTRVGEYLVPRNATLRYCPACGAEIYLTDSRLGRPVPLSVATIEQDAGGQRFALAHFNDCLADCLADCLNAVLHRKKGEA